MDTEAPQRIVLTPHEFEYLQLMLDSGSILEQALVAIRPDLHDMLWDAQRSIVFVQQQLDPAGLT